MESITTSTPTVIGLYGVSGCGKTHLLKQLQSCLGPEKFSFFEGSDVISDLVNGGLDAFKLMDKDSQKLWRQKAILSIRDACIERKTVGIVTGHFMFWKEGEAKPDSALTSADWRTYTHIIYLDTSPKVILDFTKKENNDNTRLRASPSLAHVQNWQNEEKSQLRELCLTHRVLFTQRSETGSLPALINDFAMHSEERNKSCALQRLSELLVSDRDTLEKMLVLDADMTLCASDTGKMFWEAMGNVRGTNDPLKITFGSRLGYSYEAFRQATLLYDDIDQRKFEEVVMKVAAEVKMHPEFKVLLEKLRDHNHVGALVVTCGLGVIWERVLRSEGLSDVVKVIGNGLISQGFVVTPAVKADLVSRLQNVNKRFVFAFGDSPLDLPMLLKADKAFIVIGGDYTRSISMEMVLQDLFRDGAMAHSFQLLLPPDSPPRKIGDNIYPPVTTLTDPEFLHMTFHKHGPRHKGTEVISAGNKEAAKLLMTPTRDAANFGPILREAHRRVGFYLASEYLGNVIGLEEYTITHVQGNSTTGHRLRNEEQTIIVALMRGGEPLAFGVNDAFPKAMLLHCNDPSDLTLRHLHGQKTVILADSVVNSGATILEFVTRILDLNREIQIVVVTGVVQRECISKGGAIWNLKSRTDRLTLVTLRISDNKFTGKGTADTGNRLFNTTHLD